MTIKGLPRPLELDDWTEADRAAWRAARSRTSVLDELALAAGWRAPSAQKVEAAVGYFLGWALREQGLSLSPIPELAAPEILRAYIAALRPRVSSFTILGLIVDLREFCRVAHPSWDRTHLKHAETRLRWSAVPSKDKLARLRPTSDLVALGEHLMATMEEAGSNDCRYALARYRDGLSIALLALRPLRIRAFASLQLGEHLLRAADGWALNVTPDLSKTHRPWEGTVPKPLTRPLERYLSEIRPELLCQRGRWWRDPGSALWISIDGSPMRSKALGEAIVKRTRDAFGQSISPHLFRDCAATTLALESPADIPIAAPLLGHIDPRTTEDHYNQAQSVDAGRKHLEALRRLDRDRMRRR